MNPIPTAVQEARPGEVRPVAGDEMRLDIGEAASLEERYAEALCALERVSTEASRYRELPEPMLLNINRMGAAARRLVDSHLALVAGEVAFRSRAELGLNGLAQRAGLRTPEQFVKVTTGATGRDANTAVRVGVLMHEAAAAGSVDETTGEVAENSTPWLDPVTTVLATRSLSIEQADAIRTGLVGPDSAVTGQQLAAAATELVSACAEGGIDPDALAKLARRVREELDIEGIGIREEERYQKRSLRLFPQPDGTTKVIWILDPESAAVVRDVVDRATSPKLGGVRFVDPERKAQAEAIADDDRTAEQLASDAVVQLIKIGSDADSSMLLGSGAPIIRVTATATALKTGVGLGRIDAQDAPVSIATVKQLICSGISREIIFDDSQRPLDVGRGQRLFTPKQREALAVKWGGCAVGNCPRPPSWTEIHHIEHRARDKGQTNVELGIPLCAHHHRLFHQLGWEVRKDAAGNYWLHKPPHDGTEVPPILLAPKARNMVDVQRDLEREIDLAGEGS